MLDGLATLPAWLISLMHQFVAQLPANDGTRLWWDEVLA